MRTKLPKSGFGPYHVIWCQNIRSYQSNTTGRDQLRPDTSKMNFCPYQVVRGKKWSNSNLYVQLRLSAWKWSVGSNSVDALIVSTVVSSHWTFDVVIIDSSFLRSSFYDKGQGEKDISPNQSASFISQDDLKRFRFSFKGENVWRKKFYDFKFLPVWGGYWWNEIHVTLVQKYLHNKSLSNKEIGYFVRNYEFVVSYNL